MVKLKALLTKIISLFKVESQTVSGNFNTTFYFSKRCGIVTAVCSSGPATSLSSGWNELVTVPTKFKPYTEKMKGFTVIENNTTHAASICTQGRYENGKFMVFKFTDSPENNQIDFVITYVADILGQ